MKIVKIVLPKEQTTVEILPLADWHIGSPSCRFKSIQEDIDYILAADNRYAICLGDLINNATKSSVSDVYTDLSPRESIDIAVKMLKPLADNDRILFATSGNHEDRTYKETGISPSEHIFYQLHIVDKGRYDDVGVLLFLIHGRVNSHNQPHANGNQWLTTIYGTHGTGSNGRTIGSKLNAVQKRSEIVDADIVVSAHTHEEVGGRPGHYRIDRNKYTCEYHEQLLVNTTSKLGYEPYAERYGLKPSASTTPIIILEAAKQPRVLL